MSAVRMVAYGVLELKHKNPSPLWMSELSSEGQAAEREEARQRDELNKLVADELKRYGLLIKREVVPKGKSFRTRMNTYILYGQLLGPFKDGVVAPTKSQWLARTVIHEGSFRECCVEAAKLLDAMDAAQLPDTANG